jgi:uncharacterized membrane protein YcaP (DUF421 family)
MDPMEFLTDLFIPGVSIVEKILRPILIYIFLVVILRLGGRRELAQMNAFDLVVLLTVSNTVQNAIIGNDNSLVGGMVGATALIATNLLVARFLFRHPKVDRRIEGEPVWLVRDGKVIETSLQHELITRDELLAAVHRQGVLSIAECDQVILETSGTITVIPHRPTNLEAIKEAEDSRLDHIEQLLQEVLARTDGQGKSPLTRNESNANRS